MTRILVLIVRTLYPTCVRSRRLTPLGKKFACLAVSVLLIAESSDADYPYPWASTALEWLWMHIEGGIFALLANLLPYPQLATRDGTLRTQASALRS